MLSKPRMKFDLDLIGDFYKTELHSFGNTMVRFLHGSLNWSPRAYTTYGTAVVPQLEKDSTDLDTPFDIAAV